MDYYQEWRRRFPQAEAHVFENAGHYLNEDEPDAVTEKVRGFLCNTPPDQTRLAKVVQDLREGKNCAAHDLIEKT